MAGMMVSGDRRLSEAELLDRVSRAMSGLAGLGIGEDDTVCLMLRNDFAFFEGAIAATHVGAYAVPINWHYTPEEVGFVLGDCGAKALLIHADLLPRAISVVPPGVKLLVVPTPPELRAAYGIAEAAAVVPAGMTDWNAWVAAQTPSQVTPRPPRSNMLYTSGTTGNPKGVKREPQSVAMQQVIAELVAAVYGIRPGEKLRTVVTGPLYHTAPNIYGLSAARGGGYVVLQTRFEPEELLQLIEQHRITHLHMVPTMFVRLLRLPEDVKRKYDLSSLQFVVHAAAPCPPAIKRAMIDWWGPVINEYYGATETGLITFLTSAEALKKPGTVGRPHHRAVVRIYDEKGAPLPAGQVGDVYVRVLGAPDFTFHNRAAERAAIERDGLVTAGDVGYLDEDGYLFLCDRKKDMVISGGVNIYPIEIEAVLISLPGVKDCAVFGIPDEEFGEQLCAYIEPQDGAAITPEAVKAFLRSRIAGYKVPKVIKLTRELPREDSGKIFKRKLRQPYWEQTGRQI